MAIKRILMITDNYPHDEKPYITPFFSDHARVLQRLGEVKVITLIRTSRFGYRRYVWEGVPVEAFLMPYVPRMGFIFLPLALLMHSLLLLKNLLTVSSFLKSDIERRLRIKVSGVLPDPVFGCSSAAPFKVGQRILFVGRITPVKDPILLKETARLLPGYRFQRSTFQL